MTHNSIRQDGENGNGTKVPDVNERAGADVQEMFASIAPRYDITNQILSLGVHKLWKKDVARRVHGKDGVLDLATGTGDLLPLLVPHNTRVIGGDFCVEMLDQARRRGADSGATLVTCDAMELPFEDGAFQAVTAAFGVRNFQDLDRGLAEIARVIQTGGKVVILEFGQPQNTAWRTVYGWYQRWVLPAIGGLLTGNRAAYEYLPATSQRFPSGSTFCEQLVKFGYRDVSATPLFGGIAYIYEGVRC